MDRRSTNLTNSTHQIPESMDDTFNPHKICPSNPPAPRTSSGASAPGSPPRGCRSCTSPNPPGSSPDATNSHRVWLFSWLGKEFARSGSPFFCLFFLLICVCVCFLLFFLGGGEEFVALCCFISLLVLGGRNLLLLSIHLSSFWGEGVIEGAERETRANLSGIWLFRKPAAPAFPASPKHVRNQRTAAYWHCAKSGAGTANERC